MANMETKNEKKLLTAREIQLAELEILKQVIKFCDDNDITYYLYGGTALGAIRHNGFIPWDDDIDIIMTRPDYTRFLGLIKSGKEIAPNLIVEAPELAHEPRFLICKVFDKNIRVEAEDTIDNGLLWIDIMQLDGLPDKPEKYLRRIRRLRKVYLVKRRQRFHNTKNGKKYCILRRIKSFPLRLISYRLFIKYMLRVCRKYDYSSSTLVSNTYWYNTPTKIFKKEWFDGHVKVRFEDIKANVCTGYKEFLAKRYGDDYMVVPPKDKQITHSFKAWRINE